MDKITKWVIEFQCGTRPYLPKFVCLDRTVDDHCFLGIQCLYVIWILLKKEIEMFEYIRSLGPGLKFIANGVGDG